MTAEILSIGDELLFGQTINTNAAFLGEQLLSVGIPVSRATTVGDAKEAILRACERAWAENDIVIATGGLGPTHDDITRDAVTAFFSSTLVFSELVFADIRSFFDRLRRPLLDVHRDQAMVPRDAHVIRNAKGTAPGSHFSRNGKHFFTLPGVPHEMTKMTKSYILPLLQPLVRNPPCVTVLMTTGIPESRLAARLEGAEKYFDSSSLAYLPDPRGVRLRILSGGDIAPSHHTEFLEFIRERIGECIYSEESAALGEVVGRLLREKRESLAVAESCTGGSLADLITDVPGCSEYFNLGVVAYSNRSKLELLGMDPDLIEQHGAVSPEVARAMAAGIRRRAGTSIGLSTTGIAGPSGGSALKQVGLVWIGISTDSGTAAFRYHFGEDRIRTKKRSGQAALDLVRRHLLGLPMESDIVVETSAS
jgi:nicotinamide-nucleotide amidase